jgi:branched-chain amino acid transport system permease protein
MMLFLQQLIHGLSLGAIYALIALGYTMVYGIILLINFAHGDILMIGAYCAFFALGAFGAGPLGMLLAFGTAMLVCAVFGVVIELLAYRPLRNANAPRLNFLITAIAVSFILENGGRVVPFMGPNPRLFPGPDAVNFTLAAGLSVSSIDIIVVIVSALIMLGLTLIVDHTKRGKAMRAVSFDLQAASLMGINVNKIISFTFALGSLLAGAGGVLYAMAYPRIDPLMGMMPGVKAFVAAVLGGIGSIPGAMVGGVLLGVIETLVKGFISSQYSDAISYAILIVVLLIKPTGIMGKPLRGKV